MASLRDVAAYLCTKYPNKADLSKARLTKMVYLADWKSCINYNRQMTGILWTFDHYGPWVTDLTDLARQDSDFSLLEQTNQFGSPMHIIQVHEGISWPSITAEEKKILDFVIERSVRRTWKDFIKLVYSTYPILTQPRYSRLDLVRLAAEYKANAGLFMER